MPAGPPEGPAEGPGPMGEPRALAGPDPRRAPGPRGGPKAEQTVRWLIMETSVVTTMYF